VLAQADLPGFVKTIIGSIPDDTVDGALPTSTTRIGWSRPSARRCSGPCETSCSSVFVPSVVTRVRRSVRQRT
jgi:hypothetical protein